MSRYTSQMIQRAREHFEADWNPRQISRLLHGEFGVRPHPTTVRLWVDGEYARNFSKANRLRTRARWQREHPHRPEKISPERALERMALLRERGLSMNAIAITAGVWWGEVLTEYDVRSRLESSYAKQGAA